MTTIFYSHSADASTSYRPSSAAPSGMIDSAAVNGNLAHVIKNGPVYRVVNQDFHRTVIATPSLPNK